MDCVYSSGLTVAQTYVKETVVPRVHCLQLLLPYPIIVVILSHSATLENARGKKKIKVAHIPRKSPYHSHACPVGVPGIPLALAPPISGPVAAHPQGKNRVHRSLATRCAYPLAVRTQVLREASCAGSDLPSPLAPVITSERPVRRPVLKPNLSQRPLMLPTGLGHQASPQPPRRASPDGTRQLFQKETLAVFKTCDFFPFHVC